MRNDRARKNLDRRVPSAIRTNAQAVPFGRAVTVMEMKSEVLCLTASEVAVGPLWLVDAI